ncbi:MAG: F0F1 ATP synthase subunit B [Bergeyella sp.]|nr:F0F1 ATP synthase subunit B [Bergeyella sp.]
MIIEPGIGLLFWKTFTFIILLFILTKYAWKPIINAVQAREVSIVDSLNQAKIAKKEMEEIRLDNERIIREAKIERDAILREAKELKERMIEEAKNGAKIEGEKIINQAKEAINSERNRALAEIKNQIGTLSLEIAEQILKKNLEDKKSHETLIENYLGSHLN